LAAGITSSNVAPALASLERRDIDRPEKEKEKEKA
jgi:hypothetical protein